MWKHTNKILFLFGLTGLIVFLHVITGELNLTGDEPRFLYASVSFWWKGDFSLSISDYQSWLNAHNLGNRNLAADKGLHSVIHSIILSPVIGISGLSAGRWAVTAIGLLSSIIFIFKYEGKWRWDTTIWVTLYLLSLPVFPYLRLLFAEIWLYGLLSLVLVGLSRIETGKKYSYIALFALIALPFFHIRSAPVVLVYGLFLFYRVWKIPNQNLRELSIFLIISLSAFMIFVGYFFVSGPGAAATYKPSLSLIPERIAVALFGYRHGILFYSPVALLGISGLLAGVWKRDLNMTVHLLALLSYLFIMMWGTASESYTARFWVFPIPIIIVGSVYWWRNVTGVWKVVVLFPLLFVTAMNALLFYVDSGAFLENRFGSVSYDILFYKTGRMLHPDLIAAKDMFHFPHWPPFTQNHGLEIVIISILLALSLSFMGVKKTGIRHLSLAVVLILYVLIVKAMTIYPIRSDSYEVSRGIDDGNRRYVSISILDDSPVRYLKFGMYRMVPLWGIEPDVPDWFILNGKTADGKEFNGSTIPGFQMLKLNLPEKTIRITLTAGKPDWNGGWNELPIELYQ